MFEKVNPNHPDKVADRIAGAIVDLAYRRKTDPKIAVEVLIGHKQVNVIIESDILFTESDIYPIILRLAGDCRLNLISVKQDEKLAANQKYEVRCGDNGIFKGVPVNKEEKRLSTVARIIYERYKADGKYVIDQNRLICCQSCADTDELKNLLSFYGFDDVVVNPLGFWTGGTDVDSGATNRKLGSDLGRAVTGGGLMGKDCSKADVSVNIYCFIKAQETGKEVNVCCAIGDTEVDGKPYSEIVSEAKRFIMDKGGFEKFAEWGLI